MSDTTTKCATCDYCDQEMNGTACTLTEYEILGELCQRIPYAAEPDWPKRCHDCNTPRGGQHHPGCDVERCPRCGGQSIGCGRDEVDDDDEYGWETT